jgi:hypothetical protein
VKSMMFILVSGILSVAQAAVVWPRQSGIEYTVDDLASVFDYSLASPKVLEGRLVADSKNIYKLNQPCKVRVTEVGSIKSGGKGKLFVGISLAASETTIASATFDPDSIAYFTHEGETFGPENQLKDIFVEKSKNFAQITSYDVFGVVTAAKEPTIAARVDRKGSLYTIAMYQKYNPTVAPVVASCLIKK